MVTRANEVKKEIEGVAIVMVGDFNARIFHPSWFGAQELVRPSEAEHAEVRVVHKDLTDIVMGDFTIQVTPDHFTALVTDESAIEALRDLVVGTFEHLRHTPIRQLGINLDSHYSVGDETAWHAIGDTLAPKDPWARLLKKPGMKSVSIQSPREDDLPGYIGVRVEPSNRVRHGVYVGVNNHTTARDQDAASGADELIDVLQNTFDESVRFSRELTKQVAHIA